VTVLIEVVPIEYFKSKDYGGHPNRRGKPAAFSKNHFAGYMRVLLARITMYIYLRKVAKGF
jgi:hypothetical protein